MGLLKGRGIEIGALHRPVEAPHLDVTYVDRLSREDLFKQYPELAAYPVVETGILDDAEHLATIADGSQDFVVANHVIEHMANPILALRNWIRVLKVGGRAFLAVPEKSATFDVHRPITTVGHLLADFRSPDPRRDYQHFQEFALFVSCRTFNVKPESEAEAFAKELFDTNYSIHYHVWDFPAFEQALGVAMEHLGPFGAKVVASMPPVGDEFIYVLERSR